MPRPKNPVVGGGLLETTPGGSNGPRPGPPVVAGPVVTAASADLVVREEYADDAGHQRFVVANTGQGNAPTFRIAVLASAQSYSLNVAGLEAGKHLFYTLPELSCGQVATIIVDVDGAVQETNKANNSATIIGSCRID